MQREVLRRSIAMLLGVVAILTGCIDLGTGTPRSAWSRDARGQRGRDGSRFALDCEPGGTIGSLWGTDVYTDDSSICTAAVHAGLITLASGGTVEYEIQSGLSRYCGSTRNGVTSQRYGAWSGSFAFPAARGDGTNGCTASATDCVPPCAAARPASPRFQIRSGRTLRP